jgi:flagellar basal-body rod protein FlgC
MSFGNIFNISGSAMNAESLRLNLAASNIANKNNLSGTSEDAYKSMKPLFKLSDDGGVEVANIVESARPANIIHYPNHPLADKNGNVYGANVVDEEEMADVTSATKSYELNAEVLNSIKQLMIKTIQM